MNQTELVNRQALMKSPIVAKAMVRRGDGYEAIIVHAGSTQKEFYWIYSARAKRSPRKAWKFSRDYSRDLSPQFYQDFSSFVAHYCQSQGAEILFYRIYKPRELSILETKVALAPSVNPNISMQTMWSMKDTARGEYKARGNKSLYADIRKWQVEADQPENEVHVYTDECPVCGERHPVAHWPDGKITCTDYTETGKNPALHYKGRRADAFVFGIGRMG